MYIPFEPLTMNLLQLSMQEHNHYIVLQRFSWPGVLPGKGFMASPYADLDEAQVHASQLAPKEGKLLDMRQDALKVQDLLKQGSGYRVFLNTIKDQNWSARMKRVYEGKIIGFLRTKTTFKSKDPIDILFYQEFGRVMAAIQSGDKKVIVPAMEIIK
ncbi:hypothetical protein SAMN05216436_1341 [bacterium A37T11]|nr:hypothetical protein SAMN05216436_1341 [bacterium A37T11]